MEYKINNAEFLLLMLIEEHDGVNGYQLRQTVMERGMEAWAGVSASSIYVMLKKLEKRELVASQEDFQKNTKGARGQVYFILPDGKSALMHAIKQALCKCREHDPRFNIALCGLEFLHQNEASSYLKTRQDFLNREIERLNLIEKNLGKIPLSASLLFDRIKHSIAAETAWLDTAINTLKAKRPSP